MCSGLLGCQTLGDCKELTSAMSHLRAGFPSITKEWAFPGGSVMQEMQETQVRFQGREDPLDQEMATHSNILAWRIP